MTNVEEIKAESHCLRGKIADTLQQKDQSHFAGEEVQRLKFHGTYQQDDRDQRVSRKAQNLDKAWIFMVRSKLPGGALTAAQYLEHDRIAGVESSKTESEPIYGTHYPPRKFKIAIAVPPRNDVDVYSNDLGFIAHVEAGETRGYTIVVGGGFAMTHGKINTYPALAQPLGYVDRSRVIEVAKANLWPTLPINTQ